MVPVPEFADGVRLWPDSGFQPAETSIDRLRDSSDYNGFQLLGAPSGGPNDLEFFNAVDILADGGSTYLYTAYNSGWQIWNITGSLADSPLRVSFKDGWRNDFHEFQSLPTELYFLVWDISVIDPPGSPGDTLVGVASTEPVGFSIWDAEDKTDPSQIYQNVGHQNGYQLDTANINGRSYAFVASGGGVEIYDMTRAREVGPCFENTQVSTTCGGGNPVYRGSLTSWPWGRTRYVDVLSVGNRDFIALSDSFVSNPLGVEVREILDPATGSSTQLIHGLHTISYGVSLFEYAGDQYLAAINFDKIDIYDLNNCLTTGSGCNFSNLKSSTPTIALQDFAHLQYSESNGTPYLYQGFHTLCGRPPSSSEANFEHLLDLSGLATGSPVVEVIGEDYNDPGHTSPQRRINYWSSYYDQSSTGFSLVAGKHGMFHGQYFYRAAQGVLDIHKNGSVAVPTSTVAATSSERWLSSPTVEEWVNLSGTCSTGNGTGWTWDAANAPGTPATDPSPIVDPLGSNLARVRGGLCGIDAYPVSTCADRTLEVSGTANCNGTVASAPDIFVTLEDPRPFFSTVDVGEASGGLEGTPSFPVCTILSLEAQTGGLNLIEGQPVTDFSWQISGGAVNITCDNGGSTDPDVSCSEKNLTWDTTNVTLGPEIFADGFGSGNTLGWSNTVGGAGPSFKGTRAVKGLGGEILATLTVGNDHVASFSRSSGFDLTPLGTLGFTGDGFTIPASPPADGLYNFVATTVNATEFRWEFEQEAGQPGDAGCRIITGGAPCRIVTTSSPNVSYQWPEGNVDGSDYRVGLEISNCDPGQSAISTLRTVEDVTVASVDPPNIDDFKVVETNGCDCVAVGGGGCSCPVGVSAMFTLDTTGNCNVVNIDWGDGNSSNGLSCTQATYQHTYGATGTYTLEAEACFGAVCDTQINLTNLSSPVPLDIE